MKEFHQGFSPIFDKNCKVLILGSFPGTKSREVGFYYGNPSNRFWRVLSSVFPGEDLNSVEAKTAFLLKHHIALYDIVETTDLTGSLDEDLKEASNKISNITFLLPPHTQVSKILCNGLTAYELLLKSAQTDLPTIYVPSTSQLNGHFSLEPWQKELEFLK